MRDPEQHFLRSFSDLTNAVAETFCKFRDLHGLTDKELAKKLGVPFTVIQRICMGMALPTQELAYRFVRWAETNEVYERFPSQPSRIKFRPKWHKRDMKRCNAYFTQEEWKVWKDEARRVGVTPSALASLACQRFMEQSPPWVTISRVVREVNRAQVKAILEENPDLLALLELDPQLSTYEHSRAERDAVRRPEGAPVVEKILEDTPKWFDGPAHEVYREPAEDDEDDRFKPL